MSYFPEMEAIFVASIRQEQPSTFTFLTKLTDFEIGAKVSRQSDIKTRARVCSKFRQLILSDAFNRRRDHDLAASSSEFFPFVNSVMSTASHLHFGE